MASKDKKQPEKRDDSGKSEIMHRLKTHPFLFVGTVVILVIVIVAFVFVPALAPSAGYGRGGELIFGYYNKVPIKYVPNNYFYQVQQSLARNQQSASDDPNNIFATYRTWRYAFDETVVQLGVQDEMKQAGYAAPEAVVDREVAKQFQENGRFAASRYRALDNSTRIGIWRQAKEGVTTGYYIADLMGLRTSSKEASFINSMASRQRSFSLAIFPMSSYPDSEIASYVQANPALFRITRLSRITVNSGEREARQILDSVKNGTYTFEEAARTNSQDEYYDRGGDMGIRMVYELIYEISDEQARESVINLARGSLSDLVKVPAGWAFFRAEEAVRPADTFDQAQMGKIRSYIMGNLRGRVEDWLNGEAEYFSAMVRQLGFEEAVIAGNIASADFGPIPVNYGDSALFGTVGSSGIAELAGASTNQFFWRAAFSTPLNTLSDPLVIGENVIVLFPLEEVDTEETELESYYPYWVSDSMYQIYRSYFLTNEKFDDRFEEIFWNRLVGF